MENKGQAMMTFKILIAAIVAMAVLALLLPMVSNLSGIIGEKPGEQIQRMANDSINNLGSRQGKQITFNGTVNIVPKTIATKLGYTAKNVCFNVDEVVDEISAFSESLSTDSSEIGEISYESSSSLNVKATVGCDDAGVAPKDMCTCYKDGTQITGVCCGIQIDPL
ncbi:MAG: hypothetical protein GOV15_02585 [Candidatus Diapherotrites archaeon]|nr:hypothetical protein [Candidatus Diapherotrites archaeon]